MNNQKNITLIVIVLTAVVFFTVGILVWQYFGAPKEIAQKPEEKTLQKTTSTEEVIKTEIIPSSIVDNYEKLREFLLKEVFCQKCLGEEECLRNCSKEAREYWEGLESKDIEALKILREDLNEDGKYESIGGISLERQGYLYLFENVRQGYKIKNYFDVGMAIENMELKKIPSDDYWSVVVRTRGGMGTGLSGGEMLIYTFLDNKLKLT